MPLSGLCLHHKKLTEGTDLHSCLETSYPSREVSAGPRGWGDWEWGCWEPAQIRTSRREAGPAPQTQRGAGGLDLVLAPCWAAPSAKRVESGRYPEEVGRLKGRIMSLCGHTGSPFACISSEGSLAIRWLPSCLCSEVTGRACPNPLV